MLTHFVMSQSADEAMMDSGSVLDFMSLKNYPDMTLDMLNPLGKSFQVFSTFNAERTTEQRWGSVEYIPSSFFSPIL